MNLTNILFILFILLPVYFVHFCKLAFIVSVENCSRKRLELTKHIRTKDNYLSSAVCTWTEGTANLIRGYEAINDLWYVSCRLGKLIVFYKVTLIYSFYVLSTWNAVFQMIFTAFSSCIHKYKDCMNYTFVNHEYEQILSLKLHQGVSSSPSSVDQVSSSKPYIWYKTCTQI